MEMVQMFTAMPVLASLKPCFSAAFGREMERFFRLSCRFSGSTDRTGDAEELENKGCRSVLT